MFRLANILWLVLYLATMAALAGGLFSFRTWALRTYSDADAQAQWDRWRDDVEQQQSDRSPVARRPVKSPQPPALALMSDHFTSICVISFVLSSALFVTLMILLRGVFSRPRSADGVGDRPPP